MGKRQTPKAPQDPVSLVLPPFLFLGPCSAASSQPFLTRNSITHVLSIVATLLPDGRVSISDSDPQTPGLHEELRTSAIQYLSQGLTQPVVSRDRAEHPLGDVGVQWAVPDHGEVVPGR